MKSRLNRELNDRYLSVMNLLEVSNSSHIPLEKKNFSCVNALSSHLNSTF